MITDRLCDGDIIMDGHGRLWRTRWIPMKWGETYLHAAPLFGFADSQDQRTPRCGPADDESWATFRLLRPAA